MKKVSIFFFVFSILAFSQEYVLDKNTLALWHFNENNGTTVHDLSANQVNGTLIGNPQWVDGKYGSGILLDGVDDYISFQNDSVFNFGKGGSFTIEFWIKIISNDKSNNKIILSKTQDVLSGYGFIIWIDTNNTLQARLTDNELIGQPLSGPALEFNRWYDIAFVRDWDWSNSKMFFFVDGYKVSDILDPTYDLQNMSPFYLGRSGSEQGWESTCINAVIDEIRISNVARVGTNEGELFDLFPIAKGNQYKYNYQFSDTTYHVGSLEYIQNDSGEIEYFVSDSSYNENKIDWLIDQRINLLEHYITPDIDTLYWIKKTNNFILTESLDGNHQLVANPSVWDSVDVWGDIGIWKFSSGDSIYRYRNTATYKSLHLYDSLWFDTRGLYKRFYYYEYIGNHQIYSHTKINLDSITVGVKHQVLNLPENFYLYQNYPNPFNPSTTIEYSIPRRTNVIIKVFDLLGKEMTTLVNEEKSAGMYKIKFDGNNLSSGIYFYMMTAGNYISTKKFILLK